jgi:hypothetical protein
VAAIPVTLSKLKYNSFGRMVSRQSGHIITKEHLGQLDGSFKKWLPYFSNEKYATRVFSGMCPTKNYFSVTVLVVPPYAYHFHSTQYQRKIEIYISNKTKRLGHGTMHHLCGCIWQLKLFRNIEITMNRFPSRKVEA